MELLCEDSTPGFSLPRATGPGLIVDTVHGRSPLESDTCYLRHQVGSSTWPQDSIVSPRTQALKPSRQRALEEPKDDNIPETLNIEEMIEDSTLSFDDGSAPTVNSTFSEVPADINNVSVPDHTIKLNHSQRDHLLELQETAVRLSSLPLNGTQAPAKFDFKIELIPGQHNLIEPQHHHSSANNKLLTKLILGGLIEQVPDNKEIVACTNHCFPSRSGKTCPCMTGRLINSKTKRIPVHTTSVDEVRRSLPSSTKFFTKVDVRWA
jgi:hypothetical protein